MGTTLDAFDDLVGRADGAALARWVTDGGTLAGTPVRSPARADDPAARRRLDLALRMLHGQSATQWCRSAGVASALIRRWPLPARAVVLYDETGEATVASILAVGRAGGGADVWRFGRDATADALVDRGRALLAT